MAVVILVGPSHAGKSTLGRKVSRLKGYRFHNMDLEAEVRSREYMDNAKALLEKYNEESNVHVLDFGAGFQNHPRSYEFFQPYTERMITIWEESEILFQDHKKGNPALSKNDFSHTEFREERMNIYRLSKYKLPRKQGGIENDVEKLSQIISKILENPS